MSSSDDVSTQFLPEAEPETVLRVQQQVPLRRKSRWLKLVMLCLAVAVAATGIGYYLNYLEYGRYLQSTNDATIQADQVTISSKLEGYVRKVTVVENQAVSAGALLVEIDPMDYDTKLQSAVADIAAAQAAEHAARASLAEAESAIDHARASLQAAEATRDFATGEVTRHKPLVEKGVVSAVVMSQLVAERDRAIADVAAGKAALQQTQRRISTIEAQIGQAKAQADAAGVSRQQADNDLTATRLHAPLSGQVANSTVRVGQFVQPGMRLMTIVPTEDVYVVANFKENQIGLIRPGQPATIRVDALPDVAFSGVVESVTPGTGANFSLIPPQNATGNFTKIVQRVPVRIRINAGPAARQVLVPGLSLDVEVDTRAGRDLLATIEAEQEARGL